MSRKQYEFQGSVVFILFLITCLVASDNGIYGLLFTTLAGLKALSYIATPIEKDEE